MSAIFGAIRFDGQEISDEIKKILRDGYKDCVIDRMEEYTAPGVYMGCGIQYFVPEAESETLPLKFNSTVFTADGVLDNIPELINKLEISDSTPTKTDGQILASFYSKFGIEGLSQVRGCFSFASYDCEQKEFTILTDQASNRTVYYWYSNEMVLFSTLLMPIVNIVKPRLNDRWITDFLAMDYLFMINEPWESPYEGIYCVAPAYAVTCNKSEVKKIKYWEPTIPQKYPRKTDDAYKEEFRSIFFAAVKDTMRSDKPYSILLSGGFDSNAVASVLAPILKNQGEKLTSYTSIPEFGYKSNNIDPYTLDDETELVKKTAAFFGNIETNFISLEEKNAWDDRFEERKAIEIPYKSPQNLLWIVEALKQAYSNGSRIMYTGSFGNTTISYSNFELYMNTLYKNHKYAKMFHELLVFSKIKDFKITYALKEIKHTCNDRTIKDDWKSLFGQSMIRSHMISETAGRSRMIELNNQFYAATVDYQCERKFVTQDRALRQIGEISTKHSLATGVLLRDPTKDIRILKYCATAPIDIFCKNGEERRLITKYLKDIMPPHIIKCTKKGRQSSDLSYKISQNWTNIRSEWIENFSKTPNSKYVDCRTALKKLTSVDDISKYKPFELTRNIYTQFILELESQNNLLKETQPCATISSMPLISIIVPVYNVHEYLQQCVESILKQSYRNLEIILVDDGSTDGSAQLCDIYSKQDSRIKVIHTTNQGVSKARNTALKIASGEYIGFVDADDWIKPNMYEDLLCLMFKYNAEIAVCNCAKWYNESKIIDFSDETIHVFHSEEAMQTYITGFGGTILMPAVWNKLFKREILTQNEFPNLRKYEDQAFISMIFSKPPQNTIYINHAYYYYRQRKDSLSRDKGTIQELSEYLTAQKIKEENIKKLSTLPPDVLRKHEEVTYMALLDLYCKKKNCSYAYRKAISNELKRIKSFALTDVLKRNSISQLDKSLLYISLYSLWLYKHLNRFVIKLKRLKKLLQRKKM